MENLKVSYKNKTFYFNKFNVYELKKLTEYFYDGDFFKTETLKFFGQTLRDSYLYKNKVLHFNNNKEIIYSYYVLKMGSKKRNAYTYYKFADENHERPFSYLGRD